MTDDRPARHVPIHPAGWPPSGKLRQRNVRAVLMRAAFPWIQTCPGPAFAVRNGDGRFNYEKFGTAPPKHAPTAIKCTATMTIDHKYLFVLTLQSIMYP